MILIVSSHVVVMQNLVIFLHISANKYFDLLIVYHVINNVFIQVWCYVPDDNSVVLNPYPWCCVSRPTPLWFTISHVDGSFQTIKYKYFSILIISTGECEHYMRLWQIEY